MTPRAKPATVQRKAVTSFTAFCRKLGVNLEPGQDRLHLAQDRAGHQAGLGDRLPFDAPHRGIALVFDQHRLVHQRGRVAQRAADREHAFGHHRIALVRHGR